MSGGQGAARETPKIGERRDISDRERGFPLWTEPPKKKQTFPIGPSSGLVFFPQPQRVALKPFRVLTFVMP